MQQPSLNQLNDIVEPGTASWWPPAWPVIAMAVILLCACVVIAWLSWRRRQQRRPQRLALARLRNGQLTSSEITLLCKQVALAYYSRQQVAKLSSKAWLRFLGADQFASGPSLLTDADRILYAHASEQQQRQYQALAEHWVARAKPRRQSASGVEDV